MVHDSGLNGIPKDVVADYLGIGIERVKQCLVDHENAFDKEADRWYDLKYGANYEKFVSCVNSLEN